MTYAGQRGSSLLDVVIAIVLLTIAVLLAAPILSGWRTLQVDVSGERVVSEIYRALETQYKLTSGWADAFDNRLLVLESGDGFDSAFIGGEGPQLLGAALPNPTACRAMFSEFMVALSSVTDLPPSRGLADPSAPPVCLLVGPRQVITVGGFRIPYHDVAIVAPGRTGRFHELTSFDFATGALVLGGDDKGLVLSGRSIQERKAKMALEQLERARDIYEDYFTVRFLSDPTRNVLTNFFYIGSGPEDGGDLGDGAVALRSDGGTLAETLLAGVFNPSGGRDASLNTEVRDTLLTSPWGTSMEVANRPGTLLSNGFAPEVRAPGASGDYMSSPPWTAILAFEIPGGGEGADTHMTATAMGRY